MRVPEHLDAETIYAHLDDRLEETRGRAVEAHLWRCDSCRALREECAAVLSGLGGYADRDVRPPAGYWDEFWNRLEPRLEDRGEETVAAPVVPLRRIPAPLRSLATAAVIALIVLGWWVATLPDAPDRSPIAARGSGVEVSAEETEWAEDLEMFERATIAVGSVDPLSKGIVLAGLVEDR